MNPPGISGGKIGPGKGGIIAGFGMTGIMTEPCPGGGMGGPGGTMGMCAFAARDKKEGGIGKGMSPTATDQHIATNKHAIGIASAAGSPRK